MRLPPVSLETSIGIFVGLVLGIVDMNWELRSLGVLVASGLAIHIVRRFDATILLKIVIAAVAIGLLITGTYRQIWASFTEDFPTVTGEAALTRIIEFLSATIGVTSCYIFLIRPRSLKGYRVLPAQLIAFGFALVAAGSIPIAVGLLWQFQQNRAAGVSLTGAPVSSPSPAALPAIGPQVPQITHSPSPSPTRLRRLHKMAVYLSLDII